MWIKLTSETRGIFYHPTIYQCLVLLFAIFILPFFSMLKGITVIYCFEREYQCIQHGLLNEAEIFTSRTRLSTIPIPPPRSSEGFLSNASFEIHNGAIRFFSDRVVVSFIPRSARVQFGTKHQRR